MAKREAVPTITMIQRIFAVATVTEKERAEGNQLAVVNRENQLVAHLIVL